MRIIKIKAKSLKEAKAKFEEIIKTKEETKKKGEETGQFFIDELFKITKKTVAKGKTLGLSEEESKHIIRIALVILGEKAVEHPLK